MCKKKMQTFLLEKQNYFGRMTIQLNYFRYRLYSKSIFHGFEIHFRDFPMILELESTKG